MNDCIVIIPTYSKIENIESIIRSIALSINLSHILIVIDNSRDRTADKRVKTTSDGILKGVCS
jgi:glycosyltransferase involved in cell wall biosynthesis